MSKVLCESLDEDDYTDAEIESEGWFSTDLSGTPGERWPGPFPECTLRIRTPRPPADFFQPGTLLTVSDRLKAVLEEFDARAEFFRVGVRYRGRKYTARTFYYCHILDYVDCFDHDRGEYTYFDKTGFTDRVDSIRRLAIDEGEASGHDLFRIAKGGEYIVCVSDRVAERIAAEKLTGVRLIEPAEWRFGDG